MIKEKELRLALVCFGGVSLAVYMFGITREIQKLVRASKLLHAVRTHEAPADSSYASLNTDRTRETDTESVYFEMLKSIGATTQLRVMVDIIAGASAGGINGIFLARAIAEDLPLDALRTLWLENADVEQLLDQDAISGRFSKIYMRPVLALLNRFRSDGLDEELGPDVAREVRGKLSRFVRSRWFKPPFSGKVFTRMLYDGMLAIGAHASNRASLLPPGHPLDLFVTVTDFFGHAQTLKLHSPPEIQEKEHRLVLEFNDPGLDPAGRRNLGDIADLVFAARCTASFPGAFPPATLDEMDAVLRDKDQIWRGREAFIRRAFAHLISSGSNPETAAFVDGSVLNNKPFGEALGALAMRAAHREVDRRVVYIDPNPKHTGDVRNIKPPGFFQSLRASLSTIPRNQPIRDDLDWLEARSDRAEQMRRVMLGMASDVDAEIDRTVGDAFHRESFTLDNFKSWRRHVHRAAAVSAGFTYGPYVELKVSHVIAELTHQVSALVTRQQKGRISTPVRAAVQNWIAIQQLDNIGPIDPAVAPDDASAWLIFLQNYDVGFRVRRLRFVIRRLNQLYASDSSGLSHVQIDAAKQSLYACLSPMLNRQRLAHLSPAMRASLAAQIMSEPATRNQCLTDLAGQLDLATADGASDREIAGLLATDLPPSIRQCLLRSYLGFAFYDIAVLPLQIGQGSDEFEEVRVDRISPDDCDGLRPGNAKAMLGGTRFGSFGAFFSRTYRENDYLWGRLNGAERMIDIIASSVSPALDLPETRNIWKQAAMRAILMAERPHLRSISTMIDQLLLELESA